MPRNESTFKRVIVHLLQLVLTQRKLCRNNGIECIKVNTDSLEPLSNTTSSSTVKVAGNWFFTENLCRKIGFTVEQIGVLLTGKALNFSGSLYSEEHKRKFNVENAEIKVFSDSTKPNQLFLYINRQPVIEWFKVQWNKLRPFKRQMIKY